MGETSNYTIDELEKFEALAARFARTSDILTEKVFKTLFSRWEPASNKNLLVRTSSGLYNGGMNKEGR